MNLLMVYLNDASAADASAALLREAGHTVQCAPATDVFSAQDVSPETNLVVVFAETYREEEVYALCSRLRADGASDTPPLLAAVSLYQMPLANRVRKLPSAGFVFTPFTTEELEDKLKRLADSEEAAGPDGPHGP